MRIKKENFGRFEGWVFGISLSRYPQTNNVWRTNLVFDLGKFAIAFIFGKDK